MCIRLSFHFKQANVYGLVRNKNFLGFYCMNMAFFDVLSGLIWNHCMGDLHVAAEHRHFGR